MKKKLFIVLCLCVAATLLPVTAEASSFPDVPDDAVFAEAVEYLNDIGVMRGNAQGNFNPDGYVTRAQMAAIICRMLGETENLTTDGDRFTDVPASYWANGYIAKAADLGIVGGYQDRSFKSDNAVTYEQAVKMVLNVAQLSEAAEKNGGYPDGYLQAAQEHGFLEGIASSKGAPFSRGNIALLLLNYYNNNI